MSDHAVLSPSGAERWLSCTPSARLELMFPDNAGAAASEGTLAHALGELLLREKTKQVTSKEFAEKLIEIEKDKQYEPEMYGYADDYATFVVERFSQAQVHTKDAILFLEQKLSLTDYVPEGFGTGDAVIIADNVLDIIDLKYGKGIPVSAFENKQMMLYSLGALREFDYMYDIKSVRMTIYQPRLENFSTYEMTVADLKHWAESELRPRAALAFDGEGQFVAGSHCRFCKVRATCKANADYNLELAKYEFADPVLMGDDEIADVLTRADQFLKWLSSVEEHALHEAVNNSKKWPGYKLVEGRSNRVYTDEEKVANKLKAEGFKEDILYTKKLLGITAMEKEIGKASFNTLLSDLIIKPPGKATLVPESDKRPALDTADAAKLDFAEIIND